MKLVELIFLYSIELSSLTNLNSMNTVFIFYSIELSSRTNLKQHKR